MAEIAPNDTFSFPLSSKGSLREIMDAQTDLVTTALVVLKLRLKRHNTKHAA